MASLLNGILAEQRAEELLRDARQAGRGSSPRRDRRPTAARLAALLSCVRARAVTEADAATGCSDDC